MCGPMAIIGTGLGIAQGLATVAGQQSAADKNMKAAVDNQRLNLIQNQRENVLEKDASLKDAHKASLEQRRAAADAVAGAGSMSGSTVGARVGEQNRQGSLSINLAQDRAEAADANYLMEGKAEEQKTANYISTQTISPMTKIFTVAGAGLGGYSKFQGLDTK